MDFDQTLLFEAIKKHSPSQQLDIDTLSEILHLQKGAIYKRVNGTTPLNIHELSALVDVYKISLDEIIQPDRYISMYHRFLKKGEASTFDYFDHFISMLKPLAWEEARSFVYLANELPIFYYFNFEHIFNFVFSVWNHLHWSEGRLTVSRNTNLDEKIKDYQKQIKNQYYACPVTEIWNSNMLNNLYQQIIFCVTIRAFQDKTFIKSLTIDIEKLINHLKHITTPEEELKENQKPNRAKIYINEFGNYLNIVLFNSDAAKATFIGYDYPHFAMSTSERWHNFSMDWIDKIKRRSVLISSEGYQYRELFFHRLENDFKLFQERLDKLVAVYYE